MPRILVGIKRGEELAQRFANVSGKPTRVVVDLIGQVFVELDTDGEAEVYRREGLTVRRFKPKGD